MNAFIDTNVLISYIFKIDSLNNKSEIVFKEYKTIFISNFVAAETDRIFSEKRDILINFFNELKIDLISQNYQVFTLKDLEDYLKIQNYSQKEKEKIKSSLNEFWFDYINEIFPKNATVQYGIKSCLNDLDIFIFSRKEEIENILNITKDRTNKYENIKNELKRYNVHHPDDEIALDAHDHNLKTTYNLDFITFDDNFYFATSKIKEFSFHKIKGKNDFFTMLN